MLDVERHRVCSQSPERQLRRATKNTGAAAPAFFGLMPELPLRALFVQRLFSVCSALKFSRRGCKR